MPLFSVITPTYNRRSLLEQTVATVRRQEHASWEMIIVDDGSTDGTQEYLETLRSDERIRVLHQSHGGPGAARNLALAHAVGEYVAFLDSDDLWFPWSLRVYAGVIQKLNRPSFIVGCNVRFHDLAELSDIRDGGIQHLEFPDYLASGDEWRWYGLSSFVVKRQLVMEVGGFASTPINGEDADLALRLGCAPGFVQIKSPVTFAYREHPGGVRHHMEKSLRGQIHQLRQEQDGLYPGGSARALERQRLMSPHMRSCSIACLKAGMVTEGWHLYRRTWRWHVALGRWKYLLAFPLLALKHWLTARSKNYTAASKHG